MCVCKRIAPKRNKWRMYALSLGLCDVCTYMWYICVCVYNIMYILYVRVYVCVCVYLCKYEWRQCGGRAPARSSLCHLLECVPTTIRYTGHILDDPSRPVPSPSPLTYLLLYIYNIYTSMTDLCDTTVLSLYYTYKNNIYT